MLGARGTRWIAQARGGAPLGLALAAACGGGDLPAGDPPLAGGATTIADATSSAYENPAPGLSDDELERHLLGDVAFEATFVTPPADVNAGLGPVYNNSSCAACHVRDGRGLPVAGYGPGGSQLLVRVSLPEGEPEVPGGAVPVPGLGDQVRDHATFGLTPAATVTLEWTEQAGSFPVGGSPYVMRRVEPVVTLADGSPLPGEVLVSARIPPPVFGLGLLEAVPEEEIIALADPDDADGDGISGRANRVWDVARGETVLGRFGWKAGNPDLLQQAAAAYRHDMGVGSPLLPDEEGVAEVDGDTLDAAAFYTRTLAVPMRRGWDDPQVLEGERAFRDIGCASCHVETLRTGAHEVAALSHQEFHPYTDLLLHNVGMDLADGREEFEASGTEWRTAPLWGIGLVETVLGDAAYLHDGRAATLEEAILWHGGEARASRDAFHGMSTSERAALLAFLRSL
ncbi:thiol oxidoreductase [Myxococcota bacterium]|nr:thiol oxidoreductase [Myxococcota bacterium]